MLMARLWYDYIHQMPKRWTQPLKWNQSANYDIPAKINAFPEVLENAQPAS